MEQGDRVRTARNSWRQERAFEEVRESQHDRMVVKEEERGGWSLTGFNSSGPGRSR